MPSFQIRIAVVRRQQDGCQRENHGQRRVDGNRREFRNRSCRDNLNRGASTGGVIQQVRPATSTVLNNVNTNLKRPRRVCNGRGDRRAGNHYREILRVSPNRRATPSKRIPRYWVY